MGEHIEREQRHGDGGAGSGLMKITLTAAGSAPFVLGDDAAGWAMADGFRPRQTRTVRSKGLFRGAYRANLAGFNLENRLVFVVERTFATRELALGFMASHADAVPVAGTLTLYDLSPSGQTKRSLAGAVVAEVECVGHVGVSCKFRYTIAGNGAWV
jgi:hypothetical protein